MEQSGFRFYSEQEFAAFLGQIAHETWFLSIEEENCAARARGCDYYNSCNWWGNGTQVLGQASKNKRYYGRGPLQISYPCNYKLFDQKHNTNIYENPELVATDLEIAWKTAIWVWTKKTKHSPFPWNKSCAEYMKTGEYGNCTRRINGFEECGKAMAKSDPANPLKGRVDHYQMIRKQCFGLKKVTNDKKIFC